MIDNEVMNRLKDIYNKKEYDDVLELKLELLKTTDVNVIKNAYIYIPKERTNLYYILIMNYDNLVYENTSDVDFGLNESLASLTQYPIICLDGYGKTNIKNLNYINIQMKYNNLMNSDIIDANNKYNTILWLQKYLCEIDVLFIGDNLFYDEYIISKIKNGYIREKVISFNMLSKNYYFKNYFNLIFILYKNKYTTYSALKKSYRKLQAYYKDQFNELFLHFKSMHNIDIIPILDDYFKY
jgi:hypothetical protein